MTITPVELHHIELKRTRLGGYRRGPVDQLLEEIAQSFEETWRERAEFADRIEQLYPFPSEPLVQRLMRMPNLEEVVWAQEEPKNQGYWHFVEDTLEACLAEAGVKPKRPLYAGRPSSASPATGLAKRHASEQADLIAEALGHPTNEAAPQRKAG